MLPQNDAPWPPREISAILPKMGEWDAWYSGSQDSLSQFYAGHKAAFTRPSLKKDGLAGAIQRFFWGQPTPTGTQRAKLHVPIAADISSASADLLFGEEITVEGVEDRKRLDLILDENRWGALLLEAADLGSALGSSYMRIVWDEEVAPHPILTAVPADQVLPSFRFGRLWTCTFWQVVRTDDQRVWRHLEEHGKGYIEHALYEGTKDKLGRRVPLTEDPNTEGITVNADSMILTGTELLTAVHIPNMRPQRRWRQDPLGTNLGRSDYDGVEPLMDALDEVWTSWMRDVRLAKGRIIASQNMLGTSGPGNGGIWEEDREVYTPMRTLDSEERGPLLEMHQFAIRAEEHHATANQLLTQIFRGAGYSGQTFGVVEEGAATATEVDARESRSMKTREKKTRYWALGLRQFLNAVLEVDRTVFNQGPGAQDDLSVTFPDPTPSPRDQAQTLQMLEAAKAASTKTKVQMLHPDWDEEQVDEEVGLIRDDAGAGAQEAISIANALPEPVEEKPDVPDAGDAGSSVDTGAGGSPFRPGGRI